MLAADTQLGPYKIVAPIGAGGMGEVYRAVDTRLGRYVAIKVLSQHLTHDAEATRRFEQEARAAGQINHPNILAIYDIGTEGELRYIVSELLEGESLRARIRQGAIPPRRAADYATQMARGLAAAHEHGLVHWPRRARAAIASNRIDTKLPASRAPRSTPLGRST